MERKRQETNLVDARIKRYTQLAAGTAFKMGKVYAYYDAGWTYTQIAERMNIAESSVRAIHQRAVKITEKANEFLAKHKH